MEKFYLSNIQSYTLTDSQCDLRSWFISTEETERANVFKKILGEEKSLQIFYYFFDACFKIMSNLGDLYQIELEYQFHIIYACLFIICKIESPGNTHLLKEEALKLDYINLNVVFKLEIFLMNSIGWKMILDTPYSLAVEISSLLYLEESQALKDKENARNKTNNHLNTQEETFLFPSSNYSIKGMSIIETNNNFTTGNEPISKETDLDRLAEEKETLLQDFTNIFKLLHYEYHLYRQYDSFIWTIACLRIVLCSRDLGEKCLIFENIVLKFFNEENRKLFEEAYSKLAELVGQDLVANQDIENLEMCNQLKDKEPGPIRAREKVSSFEIDLHQGLEEGFSSNALDYNKIKEMVSLDIEEKQTRTGKDERRNLGCSMEVSPMKLMRNSNKCTSGGNLSHQNKGSNTESLFNKNNLKAGTNNNYNNIGNNNTYNSNDYQEALSNEVKRIRLSEYDQSTLVNPYYTNQSNQSNIQDSNNNPNTFQYNSLEENDVSMSPYDGLQARDLNQKMICKDFFFNRKPTNASMQETARHTNYSHFNTNNTNASYNTNVFNTNNTERTDNSLDTISSQIEIVDSPDYDDMHPRPQSSILNMLSNKLDKVQSKSNTKDNRLFKEAASTALMEELDLVEAKGEPRKESSQSKYFSSSNIPSFFRSTVDQLNTSTTPVNMLEHKEEHNNNGVKDPSKVNMNQSIHFRAASNTNHFLTGKAQPIVSEFNLEEGEGDYLQTDTTPNVITTNTLTNKNIQELSHSTNLISYFNSTANNNNIGNLNVNNNNKQETCDNMYNKTIDVFTSTAPQQNRSTANSLSSLSGKHSKYRHGIHRKLKSCTEKQGRPNSNQESESSVQVRRNLTKTRFKDIKPDKTNPSRKLKESKPKNKETNK
eukprot:CAMPEP_0170524408 /NCGR_PEP_ID=MMETSP0209-20121228/9849_1 /TAXON_ID=665100 ORGANISM="Litonotus pictus, Strain P1" /NCGR_SAMPLE_ID=MMETSP0209 /ASSEMBLY_ACC=CAM_ASM_000301 /LENGTH=880 /DNA_ID=CAMNT_0010813071 /DNA_START=76 /DNA_END=2718 /DNA_ORIENTATION=+